VNAMPQEFCAAQLEKSLLAASNKGFLMRQLIHRRKKIGKSLLKFSRSVQIVSDSAK
jgi:hypothetical protein